MTTHLTVATGSAPRNEMYQQNKRLAEVSAKAAELVAELEEKNQALDQNNKALARANARGSELMAELELKDERIRLLNKALATANAEAAELMAEVDSQNRELLRLNHQVQQANLDLEISNTDLKRSQKELKSQSEKLIIAERQRVMIESIGTACHHLGQPFTAITLSLDMLSGLAHDPTQKEIIACAVKEAEVAKGTFKRLLAISEYLTEPYVSDNPEQNHILKL